MQLEERAARLQSGFEKNAQEIGVPITINRVGSMVCPFFTDSPVINFDTAKSSNIDTFKRYFKGLLDHGVSVAPSQFEGMFVSAAHSISDIDMSIEANYNALKTL
ncbi:Glutamate-1-semialdehyde 2,1-aminomutase [compost metagenome]